MYYHHKFSHLCFLSPLVLSISAAETSNNSLLNLFPQLQDLYRISAPGTGYGSRQNTTFCCLQAVNDSFIYEEGELLYTNQSDVKISGTPEEFERSAANGEFPCGAQYVTGDYIGAPMVQVTHAYCVDTCGRGWERSQSSQPGQWLYAFIGFIIPAVVFCLSIPRRRKLEIPDALFSATLSEDVIYRLPPICRLPVGLLAGFLLSILGLVVAALLAALDIFIWLSICFAVAGPMMLSAAYEAYLDYRIVAFLSDTLSEREPVITTDMRARLLFLVLVGNLDISNVKLSPKAPEDSPFSHIEKIIYNLRLYNSNDKSYHPCQWPEVLGNSNILATSHGPSRPPVSKRAHNLCVKKTRTRLRTMIECQYSFGSTVGAPVVFFLGAFIYTLLDTMAHLGNEDTSLSLAFGMWWMIIPHIAILSGLLLGGNNPNTLEGVLALETLNTDDRFEPFKHVPILKYLPLRFELAYPSRYKIQWLWLRGHSKQEWLDKVLDIYGETKGCVKESLRINGSETYDPQIYRLRTKTQPTFRHWLTVASLVGILLCVPFVFAFITAYFTPTVGLACRSATFLLYLAAQSLQIMLLLLLQFHRERKNHDWPSQYSSGWRRIFRVIFDSAPALYVWYSCTIISGCVAVFTAIGGTMMELMGVYSECLCNVSIQYWLDLNNPNVWIEISSNSWLDIHEARIFWARCAIGALVFLGFLCYVGWWYQRWLRNKFRALVKDLEVNTRKRR